MKNKPVLLSINQPGSAESYNTFLMENLCDGGAFLQTDKDIPRGSRVTLKFTLPFNHLTILEDENISVMVSGTVVRNNTEHQGPPGIGIQFHEDYRIQMK